MIEQTRQLQEIFGGGPLAAFLALCILAIAALMVLFIRQVKFTLAEKDAHLETMREAMALTAAIEKTWAEHLRQAEDAKDTQERATLALQDATRTLEYIKGKLRPVGTAVRPIPK